MRQRASTKEKVLALKEVYLILFMLPQVVLEVIPEQRASCNSEQQLKIINKN